MNRKIDWGFWLNISIIVWILFLIFIMWYKFYIDIKSFSPITSIERHNNEIKCEIEINDIYEFKSYFLISDSEREVIQYIVAGESKYESLIGKMAVAQCILNAMKQDDLTASEVREVYQYSGWDEKLKTKDPEEWEEVCHAVWCVFDNGEKVTQENILWFYNPDKVAGKFHNTQRFVIEIGNHRFYAPLEEE